MNIIDINKELESNVYPGRGILIGRTADGKKAVCAYFIMGRSENSRNRIFEETEDGIRTKAFDESKLTDPSLIIYSPVREFETKTIVTNGDQTDTIYEGLAAGKTFEESLETREFEPDPPHFTPRISGIMDIKDGKYTFKLSILKSDCGRDSQCLRYTFSYDDPISGEGRFIHTYAGNDSGDVLTSFFGEPKRVAVNGSMEEFAKGLWNSLNSDNKVSLFVKYTDIETGTGESVIINKNTGV